MKKNMKEEYCSPRVNNKRMFMALLVCTLPVLSAFSQEFPGIVPGDKQVTLTWNEVTVDSVSVIGTQVIKNNDGAPLVSPLTITGLTNGQLHAFEAYYHPVEAQIIDVAVLYAIPGEPTALQNVKVISGDHQLSLSWEPPVAGKDYTYSIVSATGEKKVVGNNITAYTLTGLPNDIPYSFKLIPSQKFTDFPGKGSESWAMAVVYGAAEYITATPQGTSAFSEAGFNIASLSGQLEITTPEARELKIVTINGQVYATRNIPAGTTTIPASKGIYFVTLGQTTAKVAVQ
ncbi:hypothetical protein FACS189415_4040 [Bacteroidia bacterium]|nr:hypothetical protein FACS189415_4040 [Bacteroidia bacterium]